MAQIENLLCLNTNKEKSKLSSNQEEKVIYTMFRMTFILMTHQKEVSYRIMKRILFMILEAKRLEGSGSTMKIEVIMIRKSIKI